MSPSIASWKPKFVRSLCSVTAGLALMGCASSIPASLGTPSPLVVASCPPRTPLLDDSFGSWVLKAQEIGGQYDKCREAALAGQPIAPVDYSLSRKP